MPCLRRRPLSPKSIVLWTDRLEPGGKEGNDGRTWRASVVASAKLVQTELDFFEWNTVMSDVFEVRWPGPWPPQGLTLRRRESDEIRF